MSSGTEETFLSVDEAAKRLAISRSVAYRMVDRGRSGMDGGWPPGTWLVATPGQERQLVRIRWERLLAHLEDISAPVATPATAKRALASVL